MNFRAQIQTCKNIMEVIDNTPSDKTDLLIKNISEVINGRQDIDQEDYEEIVEFTVLKLNTKLNLNITEVARISNVFRNESLKDINLICEAFMNSDGKLPVNLDLDKDGSLLVSKHLSMDYSGVFAQSHRLLKTYVSANNISGVKYELAKQWFLLYTLENKIIFNKNKIKQKFISDSKKQQAIQVRSFILNDYKTYMKWLTKKEPDFNFNEYFKTTPFYKETFKIDKRLLKMVLPI